jgi:zinc transporter ZupT
MQGMKKLKVFLMWASICIMTGVGAGIGSLLFQGADPHDGGGKYYGMKAIEGIAAGAMLVMISKAREIFQDLFEIYIDHVARSI